MKLVFSLAVITRNNQKIEDLIKPYMRNNEDLSLCIKEHRNYISGIIYGDFDGNYDSKTLLVKTEKTDCIWCSSAKIKDVEWEEMVELENEKLQQIGVDIVNNGVNLEKRFGFTNSIITPDGIWHGMIPLNILEIGFENQKTCENYIKDYYTNYIKPYEDDGKITILSCNI